MCFVSRMCVRGEIQFQYVSRRTNVDSLLLMKFNAFALPKGAALEINPLNFIIFMFRNSRAHFCYTESLHYMHAIISSS